MLLSISLINNFYICLHCENSEKAGILYYLIYLLAKSNGT